MTSCLGPAPTSVPLGWNRFRDSGRSASNALGLPPLFRNATSLYGRRLGRSGIVQRRRKISGGSVFSVSASLGPGLSDVMNYASSYDAQNAVVALQAQLIKLASEAGIGNLQTEHDSARLTAYVLLFSYVFAPPGGLWGLVDYLYSPIHSLTHKTYNAEDIKVGRQMGEGSYGVVYEGLITTGKNENLNDEGIRVVLKRMKNNVTCASEMHDVELYMNRRLQRTSPGACAEFLGIVDVKPEHVKGKLHQGIWLVWKFEGALTLEHYLKQRSFPEKIADILISKEEKLKFNSKPNQKSKEDLLDYELNVVRKIMKQLLFCLQHIHSAGIIHRDIKPSNLIVTEDGKIKLLDLGACVDLRTGFNYVPNETVMDPKYAPPERYVMPPGSSLPFPPDPISTLLSPLVWALNTPDRFDLYSAGIVLLQLSIKQLRHDSALDHFNLDLKNCDYDLNAWRKKSRFHENDFALLDANGKAGWELACSLLQPRRDYKNYIWPSLGESRPTAAAALRHRFFHSPFVISIPFSVPDLSPPSPTFAYVPTSMSFLPDVAQITSHLSNFVTIPSNANSLPKDKDEAKNNKKKNDTLPAFPSHDLVFHSLQDHVHHVIEQTSPIRNALNDVVVPIKNSISAPPSPVPISSKHNHVEKLSKNFVNKSSEPPKRAPSSQSDSKQVEDRKMKVTEIEITSVNLMQEIKSLIPTAASLALPLALIYAGLDSLRSYVSTTYDFGKSTMETVGPVVANSSLLIAFIYVSRLWLRQQRIKSIRANANSEPLSSSNSSIPITSASSGAHTSPPDFLSSPSSSLEDFKDLTFVLPNEIKKDVEAFEDGEQEIGVVMEWPSSPGDHFNFLNRKFNVDQSESMVAKELEALEKQMESLERCMLSERTFALQQTRLLTKMESMVLNPVSNSNLNGIASMNLHDVGVGGHVLDASEKKDVHLKDGSNDNNKDKSFVSLDNSLP